MGSIAFDETAIINSKLMELALERQKIIANNMANADTPHYARLEFKFLDELKESLEGGDIEDITAVKGEIVEDKTTPARLDGNNVYIAKEMNEMVQNSLFYNLLTRAFATRMNILKQAIR